MAHRTQFHALIWSTSFRILVHLLVYLSFEEWMLVLGQNLCLYQLSEPRFSFNIATSIAFNQFCEEKIRTAINFVHIILWSNGQFASLSRDFCLFAMWNSIASHYSRGTKNKHKSLRKSKYICTATAATTTINKQQSIIRTKLNSHTNTSTHEVRERETIKWSESRHNR